MNEALAQWEASNGYPDRSKLKIEDAMKIIADAGYDVDSWTPLTEGYQVYWFKDENRCILYNTSTKEVEYPDEFTAADVTSVENAGKFYVYNQTFKKAMAQDLTFSSSASKDVTVGNITYSSALVSTSGDSANYASAVVYQNENEQKVYHITVQTVGDPSPEYIQKAQKDAGEYLYAIFQQANQDIITVDSIVIQEGVTIDVSEVKWRPLKELVNGKIGPDSGTATIKGLTIDNSLSFTETYIAKGSSNPIYLTGFIGAVSGNSVIQNLIFEDVTIDHAASDRLTSATAKDASNSAIIGGIVANEDIENGDVANVTIKNVTVKNCTIKAVRRTAGLVGFVGGINWVNKPNDDKPTGATYRTLKGTVTIENCTVDGCTLETDANTDPGQSGYAVTGGILGFVNKNNASLVVNITNCTAKNMTLNGKVKGAIVGDSMMTAAGNINISGCTIENVKKADGTAAPTVQKSTANGTVKIDGTPYTAVGEH